MTDPAQPPAVPAAPADAAVVTPDQPVRKGSGLGIFALVLGLGAFLVDIIFFVVVLVQGASVLASIGAGDFSGVGLAIGGLAFIGFIILIGGGIAALLGVILGLAAAIKGRGRAAGIFAIIFGLLVLISRLILIATLAGSADLLSQITGGAA